MKNKRELFAEKLRNSKSKKKLEEIRLKNDTKNS